MPGDVTAQVRWLVNRRPREWREKVDVGHEVKPQRTYEEAKRDLIEKLVKWGVVTPPTKLIEGNVEDDLGGQASRITAENYESFRRVLNILAPVWVVRRRR